MSYLETTRRGWDGTHSLSVGSSIESKKGKGKISADRLDFFLDFFGGEA